MKHSSSAAIACLCLLTAPAFAQTALPWQTGSSPSAPPSSASDPGLHSVSGVPLYIDGTQSKKKPAALSPDTLARARNVSTLGDALNILGPAYVAPDDNLHIAHWNFKDGTMLTLWPQGGETLSDPVFVSPRPDCGVAPADCKDLVLNRKKTGSSGQHKHGGGSGGSSGGGSSGLSSLMKVMR